ncbi:MAG: glycogen debranching protein [SAR202 cluster bacterium]|nr:glycogen debranching protein [SAR202 cluster bacterium]
MVEATKLKQDPGEAGVELEPLLTREWLVTNGLGGYASGTISGVTTRRYHGLLVAALPAPMGRMTMLNHLFEDLVPQGGQAIRLGGEEHADRSLQLHGATQLTGVRLEDGLPVWQYDVDGATIEDTLLMPHRQNTVYVTYRVVGGDRRFRLKLSPAVNFRHHDAPVNAPLKKGYGFTAMDDRYELSLCRDLPPLRMRLYGQSSSFTLEGKVIPDLLYRVEESRGYESTGQLWSPGHLSVDLGPGNDATFVASTDDWDTMSAMSTGEAFAAEKERRRRLLAIAHPVARKSETAATLVMAADQFIITPAGRVADSARARAAGDEVRTIIAGYHWFTDWGRDTMISVEGLTLATGRHVEAGYILRTFAHYVRDGLIPNMFPEGERQGLYHTADATLWFFHAIEQYVNATGDVATLRMLLPFLCDIVEHHLKGTRFGIGVDPRDGLIRQGEAGYQLTWMDAKVGDWVVTPRRGKAVEINALWYNALKLMEGWAAGLEYRKGGHDAAFFAGHAKKARKSFNTRFWNEGAGYLYDVIDGPAGNDPACRPNQVLAVSLDHPVLDEDKWEPVVNIVREKLLTPLGLRSLAPGHTDYKAMYYGDLRSRDAAYHQGTVWGWLVGPFIDAWLRVHPGRTGEARHFLRGFVSHLDEGCIGSISEIFDAEEPYLPRGCCAQAWSVAEVLRCWIKTEPPPQGNGSRNGQ